MMTAELNIDTSRRSRIGQNQNSPAVGIFEAGMV
jgi:hypothetical protein